MSIIDLPLNSLGHFFTKKTLMPVLDFEGVKRVMDWGGCSWCGEYLLDFDITDTEVRTKTACPLPDGTTTVIDLKVPSGKIVVTDDLRGMYDWRDENREDVKEFASYNSALGQHQVIEYMADIGCAYGPVGNSCPGLYRTGDGTYVIACPAYDEDDMTIVSDPEAKDWVELASVLTGLWAYSIADHADFLSRGGVLTDSIEVVDVPPGTYRFTHHTGEKGFDHYAAGTVVFAHIEYISNEGETE